MNKTYIYSGLIALFVSLGSVTVFNKFLEKENKVTIEHIQKMPVSSAVFTLDDNNEIVPLDFTKTAEQVIDAVVHIRSTQLMPANGRSQQYYNRELPDPFKDFFGEEFNFFFNPRPQNRPSPGERNNTPSRVGAGSGVIISNDGYIVTNNHVIANADDIEVTLHDNRTYKAAVVGTDPSTDLALLQIKEKDLPTLSFINSDEVKVGEWVLAVGNPFSLNSTITAGIVSAKGRSINILRDQYAVENFIQTDAAINPGNSGGALVNLHGGLVGINTAIASPTGAYSGYGFAVPSNIVNKVVEDLIQYGVVQRGVLGIMIRSVDGNLAREKELKSAKGVYVDSLFENSAAAEAGLKKGDVIISVNEVPVNSASELQGEIAQFRPGEKVNLDIQRENKELNIAVVLKNKEGDIRFVSKESADVLKILGAEFEDLSQDELKKLDIPSGVRISKLYPGKLRKFTQVREGFIITKMDGKRISSKEELIAALEDKKGGVLIEGVYEDIPGEYYYAFGM